MGEASEDEAKGPESDEEGEDTELGSWMCVESGVTEVMVWAMGWMSRTENPDYSFGWGYRQCFRYFPRGRENRG